MDEEFLVSQTKCIPGLEYILVTITALQSRDLLGAGVGGLTVR